jgi:hypothetical protein
MRKQERQVKIVKVSATERHLPLMEKACLQCEKRFPGTKRQKYCSKRCSNLAAYHRNPDAYRESRMKSYYHSKGHAPKGKRAL